MLKQKLHFDLLIAGAGTAGLAACSQLHKLSPELKIAIADKSGVHHYQPSWSLVAVKILDAAHQKLPTKSLIPEGVSLLTSNVKEFFPRKDCVLLDDRSEVTYKCLLVACGLEMNYDAVPGIKEALEEDPLAFTIFDYAYNWKAFEAINAYSGRGPAIFTYPMNEDFKCRGAASKILFLANDVFEKNNVANRKVVFVTPKNYIFSVERYNAPLVKIASKRNIAIRYDSAVVKVNHREKSITIRHGNGTEEQIPYNLLHFTPEMRTPLAVRSCKELVNENGFVDVNPNSLQHVKYPNVFSAGDCSSLPTSKTAAAVSDQTRTLVPNLKIILEGRKEPLEMTYTGYTACPLLCGHGEVVMAEFGYGKKPMETFPFDQAQPSRFMYFLKKYVIPWLYWELVRGRWSGPSGIRRWLGRIFFWMKKDI